MKAAVKAFAYTPVISVVTPVYNTDEIWLRKAIESVRAQIYPHWELCLVNDGSTKPHVQDDPRRVRRRRAARAGGASVPATKASPAPPPTGSASPRATSSRSWTMTTSCRPRPCSRSPSASTRIPISTSSTRTRTSWSPDGQRVEPFFKPDWSPDLLLSMNYITHLSVFRRSLLEEIGGFRLGFDGSQDYDLLLRFTERARRIAHIPRSCITGERSPARPPRPPPPSPSPTRPRAGPSRTRCGGEATRRRWSIILPGLYSVRYQLTRHAARVHHHPDARPVVPAPGVPAEHRGEDQLPALRDHRPRQRQQRSRRPAQGSTAIAGKWRVHSLPGTVQLLRPQQLRRRPGSRRLLRLPQQRHPGRRARLAHRHARAGAAARGRRRGRPAALSGRQDPARRRDARAWAAWPTTPSRACRGTPSPTSPWPAWCATCSAVTAPA